jgi:hypothetical protein
MKNESKILYEVEKTLQTYDNDILLEANPFLFTRIQALQVSRKQSRDRSLILNLNLKSLAVALLVLVNFVTAVYYYEWNIKKNFHERLVADLKEDLKIDRSQNTLK